MTREPPEHLPSTNGWETSIRVPAEDSEDLSLLQLDEFVHLDGDYVVPRQSRSVSTSSDLSHQKDADDWQSPHGSDDPSCLETMSEIIAENHALTIMPSNKSQSSTSATPLSHDQGESHTMEIRSVNLEVNIFGSNHNVTELQKNDHPKKPWWCHLCGSRHTQRGGLRRHLVACSPKEAKRLGIDVSKVACKYCGREFDRIRTDNLTKHIPKCTVKKDRTRNKSCL